MRPTRGQSLRYRFWSVPSSPRKLDRALLLLGAFKQAGWFTSVQRGGPVDRSGNPLPWYTYPAIYWLETVLTGTERVFEYGSGNSTLWFAKRVRSVTAIEHDERWTDRLQGRIPDNVTLRYVPIESSADTSDRGTGYAEAIVDEPRGGFDVIVVDGKARNECCYTAMPHLRSGGLLILDNSDKKQFEPANKFLAGKGFARIDFTGPVPGDVGWSSTSVFSQDLLPWTQRAELPGSRTRTIVKQ